MKTTTLISALLCAIFSNAQDWATYYSNDALLVEVATVTHTQPEAGIQHDRIIFRFKNLTSKSLDLTYVRNVSYDVSGNFPEGNEKEFSLNLSPNELISYDKDHENNKTFYIYMKDLKGTIKKSLTNYELSNFQMH